MVTTNEVPQQAQTSATPSYAVQRTHEIGPLTFGSPATAASPAVVENEGGREVIVTDAIVEATVTIVPDNLYTVHLGPLATTADPVCYSGFGAAERPLVRVTNQRFECVTPPLPIGGPYRFTLIDALGNTFVTPVLITVVPHHFRSRRFSFRRHFPPKWNVGIRRERDEDFPQA